jgi:dihydrodipicolinate reductase
MSLSRTIRCLPSRTAHAIIDFTVPKVSVELAALAAQARIVHVIGTTGLTPTDDSKIAAAARHAVIVKSGNMSLGVTLLAALVKKGREGASGFRYRDCRDASPQQGGCAVRDRIAAGARGGGRP